MSDITGADNQNDTGQRPGWLIGLRDWVDARLPIMDAWKKHLSEYYAPKNFNFWYFFGVLSMVVLVLQLLTGIPLRLKKHLHQLNTSCVMWTSAGCCVICIPPGHRHFSL